MAAASVTNRPPRWLIKHCRDRVIQSLDSEIRAQVSLGYNHLWTPHIQSRRFVGTLSWTPPDLPLNTKPVGLWSNLGAHYSGDGILRNKSRAPT
ncbi:hypothetical protein RRG08_013129 [Elysia crispata]|uniref:Uncharacterized protein n=1 Tax=Elysia crispata TaxID=231223 RepID=A0AAE1A099_9GAST|nr:hypothetical protein RRG08_013129 [Elysia crispata]